MRRVITLAALAVLISMLLPAACRKKLPPQPKVYHIETPYVFLSIDSVKTEYHGKYYGSHICGGLYYTYFGLLDSVGNSTRKILQVMDRDGNILNTVPIADTWNRVSDAEQKLLDSLRGRCAPYKILEDERYVVTSECNGEFGGKIFFRDKFTDSVYTAHATCPVSVNKLNGKYYITIALNHMVYSASIVEIDNPLFFSDTIYLGKIYRILPEQYEEMDNLSEFINDDNTKKTPKPIRKLPEPYVQEGVNLLFDYYGDDFVVKFSFVHKGRLLHFLEDKDGTHIAEIENGEMAKRYTWPHIIHPSFGRQLREGVYFADFSSPKLGEFGFLEITPDTIRVRYFTNDLDNIVKIEAAFVDIRTKSDVAVSPERFKEVFGSAVDTLVITQKQYILNLYHEILAAKETDTGLSPDVRAIIKLYTDKDTTELYAGYRTFSYKGKTYNVDHSFRSSLRLLPHDKKHNYLLTERP